MSEKSPVPDTPSRRPALTRRAALRLCAIAVGLLVPLLGFIQIADEVREKEPLPGDDGLIRAVQGTSSPLLDGVALGVTVLGGTLAVVSAVTILVILLARSGRRRAALFLALGAGGTALLNVVIKLIYERQRPGVTQLIVENGYSFPSGHAMITASLALTIGILAWRSRYRWYAVTAGMLYCLSVSISRVYLGVHYPSDIIAGWCVSLVYIALLYLGFRRLSGHPSFIKKVK